MAFAKPPAVNMDWDPWLGMPLIAPHSTHDGWDFYKGIEERAPLDTHMGDPLARGPPSLSTQAPAMMA